MKTAHPHPLRLARAQRNLTINQLAEEVRIGASTLWRAEHAYPISAESRRRLCLFFNLTAQELGLVSDHREQYASLAEHPVSVSVSINARPVDTSSASVLLAHTSGDLAALLDAGWSLNAVLTALRSILPGVQGMPAEARRRVYEMSDATLKSGERAVTADHLSHEERLRLSDGLRQSIRESWRLYQSSPPAYVLVVARTQLTLVQQAHALLPADLRCSFYAALYNLIGAALLSQGKYAAARSMHEKAHIAALEGADLWNMAQSLNWQAICNNNMQQYEAAIQCIEAAMRLLGHADSEEYARLKAHLFADWAFNAALLHERASTQEKLEASAGLLEGLGPDEEFDVSRWHQTVGRCMLLSQHYPAAIAHLEQSLAALAPHWLVRQALTLAPLAEAYARQREREACLATGEQIVNILQMMNSPMLNRCFLEVQQQMLQAFPQDRRVQVFLERAQHQPLLQAGNTDQAQQAEG
jgi:tetratricopeptide (TPR) repeat protein